MPDRDDSTVTRCYQHGLTLARGGSYFDAHEAFEVAWRACEAEERDFFQGLVHVVVSAYQHGRGRPVAAERQRVKALRRLAAFAPAHRGLDVAALLAAPTSEPSPILDSIWSSATCSHQLRLKKSSRPSTTRVAPEAKRTTP